MTFERLPETPLLGFLVMIGCRCLEGGHNRVPTDANQNPQSYGIYASWGVFV